MNARAIWALAALLATGVAAELAWPDTRAPAAVPAPPARGVTAIQAAAEPVGAWTATTLARPLFDPERRPHATQAGEARAAPGRQEPPRLSGILVTPQGSHAIFAGADHSTIAGEGAQIAGWQVVAIRRGEVQLTGPDGARTVRPSYSDVTPGAGAAAASAPAAAFGGLAGPSGDDIFRNAQQALMGPRR